MKLDTATKERVPRAGGGGSGKAGEPNGQPPGKGKDKGKGKGKGKDGEQANANSASGSDGGSSNGDGTKPKPTSEYPGIELSAVPEDERCCLHYLWVRKDGSNVSLCGNYNKGHRDKCSLGKHLAKPTAAMKKTKLFNRLKKERGEPNCPASGPAPPTKPAST